MSINNTEKALAEKSLVALEESGFDRAACRVSADELHELQAENAEINLFRTNFETDISLVGIKDERKASMSINRVDDATVNDAVADLTAMAAEIKAAAELLKSWCSSIEKLHRNRV